MNRDAESPIEPVQPGRAAPRRIVGFTPEGGGFYIGDVFRGVEETCRARNAQLILVQTGISWQSAMFQPTPIEVYLRLAAEIRQGWAALTAISNPAEIALMAAMKGPGVSMSGAAVGERSAVVADNIGGVTAAVDHLIEHGHRRIGFVGAFYHYDILERYSGYVAALEKAGIKPDPRLCFAVQNDLEPGGLEAADAIVEAGVPLSAAFASTDTHAVALMDRLRRRGVRVPEDVAIIGFDDSELAQTAVPALTSVRQLPGEIGSAAARALLDEIDGHPAEPGLIRVPTVLVRRHSCGCFDSHEHLFEGSVDWNDPDWREQLGDVLARALVAPTELLGDTVDRRRIWPSVEIIVDALDQAIRGQRITNISGLDEAWWEARNQTRNAETLLRLVDLLEFVALCRQGNTSADPDRFRSKLRDFLAQSRLQVLRYAAIADPMRHPSGPRETRYILRSFIGDRPDMRPNLDWLSHVDAIAGCLAAWDYAADGSKGLRIEALYGQSGGAQGGVIVAPEAFPPVDWLEGCYVGETPCTVFIVPIISGTRELGVLAAALPPDHRYYEGYWNLQHAAALLAISLDNRARAAEG